MILTDQCRAACVAGAVVLFIGVACTVATTPTFRWSEVPGADLGYRIMVAARADALPLDPTAAACPDCAIAATVRGPFYTPAAGVLKDTATYSWQVQAQSSKRPGAWSAVGSFATAVVPGD